MSFPTELQVLRSPGSPLGPLENSVCYGSRPKSDRQEKRTGGNVCMSALFIILKLKH